MLHTALFFPQDFVRGWTTSGVIDLKDQLGILTTLTASRTLLGMATRVDDALLSHPGNLSVLQPPLSRVGCGGHAMSNRGDHAAG